MQSKFQFILGSILILVLLAGCGPTPEEQAATAAAMTAAAATDTPVPTATPTPTPTPTPIPYDLTVVVSDVDGNPFAGAEVLLAESEDDKSVIADESGQISWQNLPGETVSMTASAQGYYDVDHSGTIQRGSNEISLILERDPYQILPSEACQEGQELLYLEDFEDGEAQGWSDITRPKWAFEEIADLGTVIALVAENQGGWTEYREEFSNAVWQFDMNTTGRVIGFDINFHVAETPNGIAHYKLNYYSNESLSLGISAPDQNRGFAETFSPPLNDGNWHQIAFAYFDGALDIWVDGKLWLGADHKDQPIESGGFAFGFQNLENPILFDNMVVCGLSEPFQIPAE